MEFRSPKTKKHTPIFSQPSLPLRKIPLIGIFDGLHVTIHDWDNMNYIYNQVHKSFCRTLKIFILLQYFFRITKIVF